MLASATEFKKNSAFIEGESSTFFFLSAMVIKEMIQNSEGLPAEFPSMPKGEAFKVFEEAKKEMFEFINEIGNSNMSNPDAALIEFLLSKIGFSKDNTDIKDQINTLSDKLGIFNKEAMKAFYSA